MSEPVFLITDTFFIKGRGLVLVSKQNRDAEAPVRVRVGDEVELTAGDGGTIRVLANGVELINVTPPRPDQSPLGILVSLPSEYTERLRGAKARVVTTK